MRRLLLAVGCLGFVGCMVDVPDVDTETFACETDQDCASGYGCTGGLCVKAGQGDPGCTGSACQPPDTLLDSGPAATTTAHDATFAFHASVNPATFECKLDGSGFSGCTSPASYTGLADGGHHFEVKAKSSTGQSDASPAIFDWQITSDGSEPDTVIDSGPPTTGTATVATFNFHGSGSFVGFECKLDTGSFSACNSPYAISALAVGSHVFEVRTTGPQGTDSSPATWNWTVVAVDTTPPETSITGGPATFTQNEFVTFAFGCNESGCTFACWLDGATLTSCATGMTVSASAEGMHTFEVQATDSVGNVDTSPTSWTWYRDITPPVLTIYGPPPIDHAGSATFSVGCTDPISSCSVGCALDSPAGPFGTCDSFAVSVGDHVLFVRAEDGAANTVIEPWRWAYTASAAGWTQVGAGTRHTCAIDVYNYLWCWGQNDASQVGGSPSGLVVVPHRVSGDSDWTAVTAGARHSCGLRGTALYCWGANDRGQLGISSTMPQESPAQVGGAWLAVAAGREHTCAIDSSSHVFCWGANQQGVTGGGYADGVNQPAPAPVGGATAFSAVSSGDGNACAIASATGYLYCWGANWAGKLGLNNMDPQSTPQLVESGAPEIWAAVALGDEHTCGLHSNGDLYCWGSSGMGQAGAFGSWTPHVVATGYGYVSIAAGGAHTCANAGAAGVDCWGANDYGQIGSSNTVNLNAPFPVMGDVPTGPGRLSLGGTHTCAVTSMGFLGCWGARDAGQLGDGNSTLAATGSPLTIDTGTYGQINQLSLGWNHTCLLSGTTHAMCWGDDSSSQLGIGETPVPLKVPWEVPHLIGGEVPGWSDIAAGRQHGCGLWSGELWCWGGNYSGQVGDGTTVDAETVTLIDSNQDWVGVEAAFYKACGIREIAGNRVLFCWGANPSDWLGVGGQSGNVLTPRLVLGGYADWQSVTIGENHVCGLRGTAASRSLYCWGDNDLKQLGLPFSALAIEPTQVGSAGDWQAVEAGRYHTCGLRTPTGGGAALYCWGSNTYGQLGMGPADLAQRDSPTQVGSESDWLTLDLGDDYTCGIRADGMSGGVGSLWCWGDNDRWQSGGVGGWHGAPRRVGAAMDWIAVAVGSGSTCAMHADHSVECWGANGRGQLGNGQAWRVLPTWLP